jgi:hypothetical protein
MHVQVRFPSRPAKIVRRSRCTCASRGDCAKQRAAYVRVAVCACRHLADVIWRRDDCMSCMSGQREEDIETVKKDDDGVNTSK